ncbi:MAG: DUF4369 domain-containing protein, partial [Bacteroidales bacterium]|nr:DUF4369 domain-containing protein [Bacteroidales bacterium]
MRQISIFLFLLLATTLCSQEKKGYSIDLKINGLRDSTIYLAYHLGDKQYLKDTIILDHEGRAGIRGEE